ncbi:hypothetical protein TNCV_876842 [Trichonephila clavipes]|nr:hypothetical protein TNCV_876842 [Trichonephila clavipes]
MDVMPDLVILLGIQPNRKSFKPPVPYRLDAIDFSQHTIGCSRPVIKVSAHGKHVMSSSPVPLKEPRVFLSSVGRVDDHGLPHRHLDVLKSSFFKLICQASNCESSRYISLKLLSKPSLYFTYVPGLPASLKNESSCRPSVGSFLIVRLSKIIIYIMSLTVRLVCMLFAVLLLGLLVVDHVSAMHMGQRNNNGVIELLVAGLVAKLLQEHHHG